MAAKAELAAERRRVNVDEIEGIIRDAILREREFYSEVVAHVLGEALGRLDQEIKEKRDALASDLRELRRDIAGVNSVLGPPIASPSASSICRIRSAGASTRSAYS